MSVTLAQASAVVVPDAGGHVVGAKREAGKAYGTPGMGWGSRTTIERVAQNPNFPASLVGMSGGRVAPNPAGMLLRDAANVIVYAVGISGDTGDNDDIIAMAGIEAAGLKADPGGAQK